MKSLINISFFLISIYISAQTAFKNFGNIKIHNNAKVGFHTNLINDGTFNNNNKGFTGFYHDTQTLTVSGLNRAVFNNVEVAVINNLKLETSMGVTNDFSFLEGKVITPKNDVSVSLDFINHNMYVGEANTRYVDGYASVINSEEFIFPIGDDNRLRTMILPNQSNNFKGAYFYENPNTPSTFISSFNTDLKESTLGIINTQEFWDLNGNTETTITLTWDALSNITLMTQELKDLRVVGWSENQNQWVDLGNTFVEGNLNEGKITSKLFVPNLYTVITIGSSNTEEICSGNYLISPNGDSANDRLKILCLKDYPKTNELSVYNRWGTLVYREKNYSETWQGYSRGRATIVKKDGLPAGTYFYLFKYGKNLSRYKKGWVYVTR